MTNVGERIKPQYTYTAQLGSGEPKPIAVRDGHPIGPSRYAKPGRENLNSPKTIAIRDGRSSATIAVRGVFREQNDYFNRRGTRSCFLDICRGVIWSLFLNRLKHKNNIHQPTRVGAAVETIPGVLETL
ncbi:hypothetical protein E3N88_35718 [Mikania micrantha]|uniref:Uncharacterized protein n=1 Tax=Mikania micrantha TaxID=192012 RepID=A0A5N6M225_9ASTR|nr:hypothetical protein E3N88_35718 [Mikania micrantha]